MFVFGSSSCLCVFLSVRVCFLVLVLLCLRVCVWLCFLVGVGCFVLFDVVVCVLCLDERVLFLCVCMSLMLCDVVVLFCVL